MIGVGLAVVLWTCILLVAHTYVLFPLLLSVLSRHQRPNQQVYPADSYELPALDILLAAHNEEQVIEEKIRRTFLTTYPLDRLTFYIGSDCSVDRTNTLVERLQAEYPQLRFQAFSERQGKPGVMAALSAQATAPVLVLTDANVFFEPDTLYQLVKHFANPRIGLVGANITSPAVRAEGVSGQETAYLERENLIKYQEGVLWGAMIGAGGGCFAVRREAYFPAPVGFLVDDFYISMAVLRAGYQAICELQAVCLEDVGDRMPEEFRRKARISAGNFQNLAEFRQLLRLRWGGVAFAFWSHKVLRWITPALLLLALSSNLLLVLGGAGWFYQLMLAGQVLVPLLGGLDWLLRRRGVHVQLLRFIRHFYSMNAALLVGWWRYVRGIRTAVWQPTQRFQQSA